MVDREKVAAVLKRRFPEADAKEVAAATNAIVGLADEWEELSAAFSAGGPLRVVKCAASCYLADVLSGGGEFRVFKRLGANDDEG
jgi:hypothetical protein